MVPELRNTILTSLLLVSVVQGLIWSEPHILNKTRISPVGKVFATYMDTLTNDIHVLWLTSANVLQYSRVNAFKGTTHTQHLAEFNQFATGGAITGANDGKRLFMAVSQSRNTSDSYVGCEPALQGLSPKHTGSCPDVFFLESVDGGSTWTAPVAVPRRDMDDVASRGPPSLFLIPTSERLFLFYPAATPTGTKVMMATRAKGSHIFSNEQMVAATAHVISEVNAIFTTFNKQGQVSLYLGWLQKAVRPSNAQQLMTTISVTLGISWSEPKVLGFSSSEGDTLGWSDSALTSYPQDNEVYAAFGGMLLRSINTGMSWDLVANYSNKADVFAPDVVACVDNVGAKKVFVISATGDAKRFLFGTFLPATGTYTESAPPFGTYTAALVGKLVCSVFEGTSYVHSAATAMDSDLNYDLGTTHARLV